MKSAFPVSPLSLNQLTREYWGQYDAAAIAQLAAYYADPCYRLKFYKSPADNQEVLAGNAYVTHGLTITTGSLIFGYYLPCLVDVDDIPLGCAPPAFTVQIVDVSLQHRFWDDPISSLFLSNFKPTFQSGVTLNMGSFPNLMRAPQPVVGSGQFDVKIQSTSDSSQRIELVLGVLEACG